MYKVINKFADLQDNKYRYNIGDIYPREGYEPTAGRVAELSGSNNKQKKPLIEEVIEIREETPETTSNTETDKEEPKEEVKAPKRGKKTAKN